VEPQQRMPTISVFYGIVIQMFWNDHAPPHFHALYGRYEAIVEIETLRVARGSLPRTAMALVFGWAEDHRPELMENWKRCRSHQMPIRIAPLT
jgi:hypothetical protein